MAQADFEYQPVSIEPGAANDAAGVALAVSVYADRQHVRDTMRDDAQAAGFRLGQVGALETLLGKAAVPLGDVILLDCPVASAPVLAALSRLDTRATHSGAQLIVSTSVEGLDGVFGCLERADMQLLVDPTRGDRVIALGRALAKMPGMRLREINDDDRLTLLRLTEQVGQIAERLERMGAAGQSAGGGAFRFETPDPKFNGQNTEDGSERLVRAKRPAIT